MHFNFFVTLEKSFFPHGVLPTLTAELFSPFHQTFRSKMLTGSTHLYPDAFKLTPIS
jgi:hypothetical protein